MARTLLFVAAWFAVGAVSWAADETQAADEHLTFERDVWPIFREHCFDCHGATEELSGQLDLRQVRLMQEGGESGPAITAGRPDESYLLDRIRGEEMPPGEVKVPAEQIAILERWIAEGARTARPEPDSLPPGLGVSPEERSFWSFQPIHRPQVPAFAAADRVRTPIDAFLLARLREAGLSSFSDDADRRALIHRASFDLIGLPPTAAEVERFVGDTAPDAYEKLIDRLLASPQYGERWARHWLDVAGYADSEGAAGDPIRPDAWKYRDYVVRAFNADKSFDRFIVEQLAGDELVPAADGDPTPERIEALTATGFLRMAPDSTAGRVDDADAARNQVVADTLQIVSSSLLGLSVACAQCHDHRYDPIPHTDYFRLRAVFEPALDWKAWRTVQQRRVSLDTAAEKAMAAKLEAEAAEIAAEKATKQAEFIAAALETELEKHPEELRDALRAAQQTPAKDRSEEQKKLLGERPSVNITPGNLYQYDPKAAETLKEFDARIAAVRGRKPPEKFVRALTEPPGHQPTTFLFHRGDHRQPTDEILPGLLTISAPEGESTDIAADDPSLPTTGRRLAYARRLTDGTHPLVARVIVNRIWMHHFGRGIVETPSDFGKLGVRPTHPELLDWLADEFMRQDWSVKQMHRLIMLSTAYRQSSLRDSQRDAVDADGRLYSRMPVQRLDAEVLRDRVLAASGTLDESLFGPPVPVKEGTGGMVEIDGENVRRSLYLQVRRSQPLAFLTSFDAPVMDVNCERRVSSTVATQALLLMNGEFLLTQSQRLAERIRREAAAEPLPTPESGDAYPDFPPPVWQYGYAAVGDGSLGPVDFQPLPHWSGKQWQGGADVPDASLGWVVLRQTGGHPGGKYAVVRRWVAPKSGIAEVTGALSHASENGDGVRARLVSSRHGQVDEWIVAKSDAATTVGGIEVHEGDTLDFVVDCRTSETSDSFTWTAQIALSDSSGATLGTWDSATAFGGPPTSGPPAAKQVMRAWRIVYGRPATAEELQLSLAFLRDQFGLSSLEGDPQLAAMTNLCQALLSSNEFLYTD